MQGGYKIAGAAAIIGFEVEAIFQAYFSAVISRIGSQFDQRPQLFLEGFDGQCLGIVALRAGEQVGFGQIAFGGAFYHKMVLAKVAFARRQLYDTRGADTNIQPAVVVGVSDAQAIAYITGLLFVLKITIL